MAQVSEVIRGWLGWCPNAPPVTITISRTGTSLHSGNVPDTPQPGTSPAALAVSHVMTGVSVVILFATCFVGGNIWWPPIVLAVLTLFVFIHIRTLQTHRRA